MAYIEHNINLYTEITVYGIHRIYIMQTTTPETQTAMNNIT